MARQLFVLVLLALLALAVGVIMPDRAAANPLTGVASVSAGAYYTCALTTNGTVKCWGYNGFGQFGDGTTSGSNIAVNASGLTTAVGAIDAGGQTTCALTPTGGLKCWGDNATGELGIGNSSGPVTCSGSACSTTPLDVGSLTSGVAAFSVGAIHTCAVTASGGLKCWGWNRYGQLGNGSNSGPQTCGFSSEPCSTTPVDVSGLTSGVAAVSAGETHTCALTTVGGVKCWGSNGFGELGDGQACGTICPTPVDVTGLTSGVAAVSAGSAYTCAVTTSGGTKCWGQNGFGQLGNGATTDSSMPVDVTGLSSGVSAISAGLEGQIVAGSHTCALTASGGVKCWGSNTSGQLGDGTSSGPEVCAGIFTTGPCSRTPVAVTGLASGASGVSTGGDHTCAVTTSGGVECWGSNFAWQLGDGVFVGPESCSFFGPCSTTPVDVVGVSKPPLTPTPMSTDTPTGTSSATPTATSVRTATTTPIASSTPPSVGGVSLDPGARLSPERSASHRSAALPLAALALVGVSGAAGAAWLARRRLPRTNMK